MTQKNLGDALNDIAYQLPDQTATIFGDRYVTFGQQLINSKKLSSAIARLGGRRQDRIAMLLRNCPEYMDIFGAAQLSGFIATTVNFRLAAPEISYILADSKPLVLFFEEAFADSIARIRSQLTGVRCYVCLGNAPDWAVSYEEFIDSGADGGAPFSASSQDVLHLIYTSGTTGRPKGVMRTHAAELEYAQLMTTEVGVLREDVVQIMMPLFHVGARWLQLGCTLRGAPIVLHGDFDEEAVMASIDKHRVTVTHMAPTIVQRILEHPKADHYNLSSLRTVYYAAAPMPLKVLELGLKKLGPVFVQLYGMTEGAGTTLHKSQHRPFGTSVEQGRLRSVGQASGGVAIRILDDEGAEMSVGVPGEVATRTSTHMLGYWNNSTATLDVLRDGWYRTGDVGYLDDKGYLFLVDRKKDMIISGGENIYCREVEEAILLDPAVSQVAVIGMPDPIWGESVQAVVVLNPGFVRNEADIVEHCKLHLASYKKPRAVKFIDFMPCLTTGKIDKKQLRAAYAAPQAVPVSETS